MSSTRKAAPGSPLSQIRYMSAPEYAQSDGVKGMPLAVKAKLYNAEPDKKALLLFLQKLSASESGFEQLAQALIADYPDRLATPTMHKHGLRGDKFCTAEQVRAIRVELGIDKVLGTGQDIEEFPLRGEIDERSTDLSGEEFEALRRRFYQDDEFRDEAGKLVEQKREQLKQAAQSHPDRYPASVFVKECRARADRHLERFLWEFCINPRVKLHDESQPTATSSDLYFAEDDVRGWESYRTLPYFHDITGALLNYKRRHEEKARLSFVQTEISRLTSRTLERGLSSRKIVVIEGVEGIGKSFSGKCWANCHLGEARYVLLEGIVTKTTFFQAVSGACGLADGARQKSQDMQARIRDYLQRTGIMLVIDEAHRLFQQTERITSHPELLNWVYTLWDLKIPVALLVTPQFASRMGEVARQTDWRSGQFTRRVIVWTKLPQKVRNEDILNVARWIAPRYTPNMIAEIVDYAAACRSRQLDAMIRAVSAAEFIAEENERKSPTGKDLLAGIADAQATDLAMTTPGDIRKASSRGRRQRDADLLQETCNGSESVAQESEAEHFPRAIKPARATRSQLAEVTPG